MVNRNVLPRFGLLDLLLAIQSSPLPAHADPETSRPMMQGVNGAYRFSPPELGRIVPFATFNLGGLAVSPDDPETATFLLHGRAVTELAVNNTVPAGGRTLQLADGNTFFKANRLLGMMDLQFDAHRALPDFVGRRSNTWNEPSGGIIFAWVIH